MSEVAKTKIIGIVVNTATKLLKESMTGHLIKCFAGQYSDLNSSSTAEFQLLHLDCFKRFHKWNKSCRS